MCFLLLFLASSLAAPLLDPAPLDCASIKSPIDPDSKLPILAVRDQTDGSCVVECDMKRGNGRVPLGRPHKIREGGGLP